MNQRRKHIKITVNVASMIALILFCIYLLPKIVGFLLPFIIAGIIAMIADPIVKFLEKKIKIKRKAGSAVVIVLVLAIVCLIVYAVVAKLIQEAISFMSMAPSIWKNVVYTLQNFDATSRMKIVINLSPDFKVAMTKIGNSIGESIAGSIDKWLSATSQVESDSSAGLTTTVPNAIISVIMTILASYMFVADRDYMPELINKIVPKSMMERFKIVTNSMKTAVGGYFTAQIKIMGFVYAVLLVGFLILRVDYAALVALLIAILDFLPFFGTGTAMVPWAIIAFMSNNYKLAVGIIITWALSQLIRQLVQPKFLSDSMGLPPIPTLFLLYAGFRFGGALGLIFAVPIGMIILNLYKAEVFSNFIISMRLLYRDFAKLRRFTDEDLREEGIIKTKDDKK